jgi:hypothetical protein
MSVADIVNPNGSGPTVMDGPGYRYQIQLITGLMGTWTPLLNKGSEKPVSSFSPAP